MNNSILRDVRVGMGAEEDYTFFDDDLIIYINMALNELNQVGVGIKGFVVSKVGAETWADFLGGSRTDLSGVKSYVIAKTKLVFDPPASSYACDYIKKQADETLWRLNVEVDPGE